MSCSLWEHLIQGMITQQTVTTILFFRMGKAILLEVTSDERQRNLHV